MGEFYIYFLAVSRWACALLSLLFAVSYLRYYLSNKTVDNIKAQLVLPNGKIKNIFSFENLLGKGKKTDIGIQGNSINKRHAVLFMNNGVWSLAPIDGKVFVNSKLIKQPTAIRYGDDITIGNATLEFRNYRQPEDISSRRQAGALLPLVFLCILQVIICISLCLRFSEELNPAIPLSFIGLIFGEWVYYAVSKKIKHSKMFMELCVLYLSTVGLAICSSVAPERLTKQVICYIAGFGGYLGFTLFLKLFPNKSIFKLLFMAMAVMLLYVTAFFGSEIGGSKNWLEIGSFSFQPSEICKALFVFAGCATLYTVVSSKRVQWEFIIFSFLCIGALALMLDFGAAAIFFMGMLVLLSVRLTSSLITGGICVGFGVLGVTAIAIYPYILRRFETWLHAWEYANAGGFQQTRTMIAAASGGALGVGGGNGYLSQIAASETDLVFGIVCEEWGSVIAITVAFCIVMLGLYAYRLAKTSPSLFYSCGVCASAVMTVFQSALNIFGSLDILPLTGVTLVFISCGGTSVISAWLMMAFYKAAEISHSNDYRSGRKKGL